MGLENDLNLCIANELGLLLEVTFPHASDALVYFHAHFVQIRFHYLPPARSAQIGPVSRGARGGQKSQACIVHAL